MTGKTEYEWNSELNEWLRAWKNVHYWSSFVGIDNISESETFNVFPNPSSGNIYLYGEKIFNKDFKLELVNINGQIIYSKYFNSINHNYNIDLPDISKGMYILKIQGNDFVRTEKIIVK